MERQMVTGGWENTKEDVRLGECFESVGREIKMIAEYDLKVNFIQNAKKYKKVQDKDKLLGELESTQEVESHVKCGQEYKKNSYRDLDNSNGSFPPMGIIYAVLWGWGCAKDNNGFRKFKLTTLFDRVLFGGDWIYSLGWCKDNDEESYKVRGCIGTFTLVPAYFNGRGHGNRNWEDALCKLKENWEILKWAKDRETFDEKGFSVSFDGADYRRYINSMFLWDFDEKKCDSDETNRKIMRRSYFMAAMLKIAVEFKDAEKDMPDYKENWGGWEVSNIYKYIVKDALLTDQVYTGYGKVIEKIVHVVTEELALQDEKLFNILLYAAREIKIADFHNDETQDAIGNEDKKILDEQIKFLNEHIELLKKKV